ncbi:hypothetical protein ACNOYE_03150 [Nannocystaceae bacterium ST9]
MRTRSLALLALLTCACTDDGSTETDTGADEIGTDSSSSDSSDSGSDATSTDTTGSETTETSAGETVLVSGDAFAFGPGTMIPAAAIHVLEMPEYTTSSDAAGHFEIELPAGSEATFVLEKAGYPTTYTKTFTLPDSGTLERVTFQVPDDATFAALSSIVMIDPDPTTCQLASTVTRVGKSIYDAGAHGEAGATVTIEPALPAEHGPVYFNANVIPQKDLTETSEDGGVLYTNVPPGTYVLRASKAGVEFVDVTIRCDADVLVNPSPPNGLQAL